MMLKSKTPEYEVKKVIKYKKDLRINSVLKKDFSYAPYKRCRVCCFYVKTESMYCFCCKMKLKVKPSMSATRRYMELVRSKKDVKKVKLREECIVCRKPFKMLWPHKMYCSIACGKEHRKNRKSVSNELKEEN